MEARDRMKVMLVFGTRPEAIKMCPVVNELKGRPGDFDVSVCVTGQHREMLDQVLEAFGVVPDHDLSIMKPGQTLFDVTCGVLLGIRAVLEAVRPDVVLVHGDTTTSFAAALAAFYLRIPVGHVEAGLRTRNLYSPWPEEFNRQAVDVLAKWYFAPTDTSRQNLLREGKPAERVYVTGNTGIDALGTTVREGYRHPDLDWAQGSRLVLLTAHRRENWGAPMHGMFRAIRRVMEDRPDTKAIYPVHMNRRCAKQRMRNWTASTACASWSRWMCSTSITSWRRRTSSSPTRAAFRRRRRALGCPCWFCATPPSAPKAWRRERSSWSARPRKTCIGSFRGFWTALRRTPQWRMPPTPTATGMPAGG